MGRLKKILPGKKKPAKRSVDDARDLRSFIARRIKKNDRIVFDDLKSATENFRTSYVSKRLLEARIQDMQLLESDDFNVTAYRYRDGDAQKIVITDLEADTGADHDVADKISAIIESAEFAGAGRPEVFLTANDEVTAERLREAILLSEPDLLQDITFIRKVEQEGLFRQDEIDDGDESTASADDSLELPEEGETFVMDAKRLTKEMGEDPKSDFLFITRSAKYKAVVKKLNDYHRVLDTYRSVLEDGADSGQLLNTYSNQLRSITEDIKEAIATYATTSKSADSMEDKGERKEVMQRLRDQLHVANGEKRFTNREGMPAFRNLNRDLEIIRKQYWMDTFNPLTDDRITPAQGTLLGFGAQGAVYSRVYDLPDDDNGDAVFEAAVKTDDIDKFNSDAEESGIHESNPEQSKRSVSSYRVNQILNMDVIPRTEFMVTGGGDGRIRFGQAMGVVHGSPGQVDVHIRELSPEDAKAVISDAINGNMQIGVDIDFDSGRAWNVKPTKVRVELKNAVIQKGLSDLQVLDNIIGHADRHPGNYIFETAGAGSQTIIGIKGIDNDDAFGEKWKASTFDPFGEKGSKTPGLPPVIDINTALNLLRKKNDFKSAIIEHVSFNLNKKELKALSKRFDVVLDGLAEKIRSGGIAVTAGEDISDRQLDVLAEHAGIQTEALRAKLMIWGDATIGSHEATNSYLGQMQRIYDREDQQVEGAEGTTQPVFK